MDGWSRQHTSGEANRKHWKLHINEVHVLVESIGYRATISGREETPRGIQGGFQEIRVQCVSCIVYDPDDEYTVWVSATDIQLSDSSTH